MKKYFIRIYISPYLFILLRNKFKYIINNIQIIIFNDNIIIAASTIATE